MTETSPTPATPFRIADQLQQLVVPLASLHPDPANLRIHNNKNLEAIAASLAKFGQLKPIVVQRDGMVIRAGNGTAAAAKAIGWDSIAAVVIDMTDTQAVAFSIADNRSSELGEWDVEDLLAQLRALQADDAELFAAVGFDDADLQKLIDDLDAAGGIGGEVDDPGPTKPPTEAVARRGELWILGDHKLLCGDATDVQDLQRLLGEERPALFSSDPPYCVKYSGADRPQNSGKDWTEVYNEIEIEDLGEFLRSVFRAVLPRLQDDAGIYIWHAHTQYPVLDRVFQEFDLLPHQPIIWHKPSSTFTYSFYRWEHEPCLFGWKKGHKPPHYLENTLGTVWAIDWEGRARISSFHPMSKPPRLFEIPMEQHTKPGAVVLEPFSGSGSQIIAAEKLGRRCRAMEISPPFVDGTIDRWQQATGKVATLDGDGRTFVEVAAERRPEEESA